MTDRDARVLVVALALLAVVGCNRPRQRFRPGDPCPPGAALPADREVPCRCGGAESGAVWGTGVYTLDSNICAAARHAGEPGGRGGEVVVARGPGCPTYVGSTRHGVSSQSYGAWPSSFHFPARAEPGCRQALIGDPPAPAEAAPAEIAPVAATPVPAAPPAAPAAPVVSAGPPSFTGMTIRTTVPDGDGQVQVQHGGSGTWASEPNGAVRVCPEVLPAVGDGSPMRGRCWCGGAIAAGPVWGAGPYALDSNLCAAALHAGVATPRGRVVEVQIIPGCPRYPGATGDHGIHARASDGTPWAFVFAGRPATCAGGAAPP